MSSDASMKRYRVKKDPADMFRGDWYIPESEFYFLKEVSAASLTLKKYGEQATSWVEFGCIGGDLR